MNLDYACERHPFFSMDTLKMIVETNAILNCLLIWFGLVYLPIWPVKKIKVRQVLFQVEDASINSLACHHQKKVQYIRIKVILTKLRNLYALCGKYIKGDALLLICVIHLHFCLTIPIKNSILVFEFEFENAGIQLHFVSCT